MTPKSEPILKEWAETGNVEALAAEYSALSDAYATTRNVSYSGAQVRCKIWLDKAQLVAHKFAKTSAAQSAAERKKRLNDLARANSHNHPGDSTAKELYDLLKAE